MLSLTACGGDKKAEEKKDEPAKQTEVENKEAVDKSDEKVKEEKEDKADKASEVKSETFEIVLPRGLFSEGTKVEEEISNAKANKVVTDGKLNEDGSVTYTVTKDQQTSLLENIKSAMNGMFAAIIKDDSNSIKKIEVSDDMSEFKLFVDEAQFDEKELDSAYELHLTSSLYNAILNKPESKTMINVLNNETGDLIKEVSSEDFNKTE